MLQGHQSWEFKNKPIILGSAAIVGPYEANSPLSRDFDTIHGDLMIGQDSWEQAERTLVEEACEDKAIEKAGITKEDINFFVCGDLMNQMDSSSFAARTLATPFIGVFVAGPPTSMESLAIASLMVDGQEPTGLADRLTQRVCGKTVPLSHRVWVTKNRQPPSGRSQAAERQSSRSKAKATCG